MRKAAPAGSYASSRSPLWNFSDCPRAGGHHRRGDSCKKPPKNQWGFSGFSRIIGFQAKASHPVGARAVRDPDSRARISLKKAHLPEPVSKVPPSRADHQEIDISTSFESLGLLPELLRAIAEQGY